MGITRFTAGRNRRSALLGALAVGFAVLVGVPVQAEADVSSGFVTIEGVVRIEKTSTGPRVALYETPTSPTPVRAIPIRVNLTCGITNVAQLRELLDISVQGAQYNTVRLFANGIGTGRGLVPTCLAHDAQLWPGEKLVIKPGTALTSDFVSASANIEGHNNASLAWSAASGATTVGSGTAPLVPESGLNDNTIVPIEPGATFDSLTLSEAGLGQWNSAISVENGGDRNDGKPTELFLGHTKEYTVDCTEANTVSEGGEESVSSVTFERQANGFNAEKDSSCVEVGVTIDVEPNASTEGGEPRDVLFLDHTTTGADGTPQEVRALATIVWRVPRYDTAGSLRTGSAIDLEFARQITYDVENEQYVDVEWCGRDVAQPAGFAAEPEHPAGHPWCVVSDDRVIDGDDIVQTVVFHGMGDPKFR